MRKHAVALLLTAALCISLPGCGGQERDPVRQNPMWHLVPVGTAWKVYNQGLAVLKSHKRKVKVQEIYHLEQRRAARRLIRSNR